MTNQSQGFICETPRSRKDCTVNGRVKVLWTQETTEMLFPTFFFFFFYYLLIWLPTPQPEGLRKVNCEMINPWPAQTQEFRNSASHSQTSGGQASPWTPGAGSHGDRSCTSLMVILFSRLELTTELLGDVVARAGAWPKFVFSLKINNLDEQKLMMQLKF